MTYQDTISIMAATIYASYLQIIDKTEVPEITEIVLEKLRAKAVDDAKALWLHV